MRRRRPDAIELGVVALFVLGFVALMGVELARSGDPRRVTPIFFVCFWFPLLAIHELGHALAARLVGWRIDGVVLGFGRRIGGFRVGRVPVELRAFPVEGFVLVRPGDLRAPRLKNAFIYFAGPGIELAFAAAVWAWLGSARMFAQTADLGLLAVQTLAAVAAVGGVFNLIPMVSVSADRVTGPEGVSDGLGILRGFLAPRAHYERMMADDD